MHTRLQILLARIVCSTRLLPRFKQALGVNVVSSLCWVIPAGRAKLNVPAAQLFHGLMAVFESILMPQAEGWRGKIR
jgi:hypothetical protein